MSTGQQGYAGGAIADQTLLLQDIRNGLGAYNMSLDPVIAALSEQTIRETLRVSQAPKAFRRKADGGMSNSERSVYRRLSVPFETYDLNSEFTIEWLQDALDSDIMTERDTAVAGDIELVHALFWTTIFTKQTVGSIAAAYQAGFYNGETDVPSYKNNSFGSAHFHYLGLNTTTLTRAHLRTMKNDVQEHGYGLTPGSLHLWINTDEQTAVLDLMDTNASSSILQGMTSQRERAIDSGITNTGVSIDGVQIHVDDNVPSGYLGMIADDVKPVARREHFRSQYQGLQIHTDNPNSEYPLAGMKFMRRIGFAIQHLGAGTCRQLVGSTTYTNPTFRSPIE
jgi:hypothetical protein